MKKHQQSIQTTEIDKALADARALSREQPVFLTDEESANVTGGGGFGDWGGVSVQTLESMQER